jgi:ketosteroid isomerase-like protein
MSEENQEIIRKGVEAFATGDIEAMTALTHPDAVMTPPEGWPEPGPFIGREAVVRQLEQISSQFEQQAIEIKAIESRGDWVVCDYYWRVRGVGSGAEVEFQASAVQRLDENGLVIEAHHRWDHDQALKAAGLSE